MMAWSEKRRVAWLAFAAGVLAGCSSAPAIPGNNLAIGADPNATRRRSPSTSDDSPEGQMQASTELQDATPPGATPPASDKGDDGTSSGASAPAPAPAAPAAAPQCPGAQSCTGGTCKTGAAAPAAGTSCVSDGQRNPGGNGAGQICGAQRSCVPGCRLDNQCPGVEICVKGACQ